MRRGSKITIDNIKKARKLFDEPVDQPLGDMIATGEQIRAMGVESEDGLFYFSVEKGTKERIA